ncbi:MAG: hypothetical protein ABL883_06280 [Terricaulis sp.]
MLRSGLIALALTTCAIAPALAQDDEDEIVVTGSRLVPYERFAVPHVFITRRADFAVVEVEIRNDTRDTGARRTEIVEALHRMETGAMRARMTLVLVDDDIGIVRQYSQAAAEQVMEAERRADTTRLTVRVRTAVTPTDTLVSIHERVATFVAGLSKPGRVEMSVGDTDLSMVNLEQYREGMLQQILAEGRSLSERVGGAQVVTVGGLESQVGFRRTDDLDLVLFIPYQLSLDLSDHP